MTTPELIAAIKLTNNGYIFAPTGAELAAAKRNPQVFILRCNAFGGVTINIR